MKILLIKPDQLNANGDKLGMKTPMRTLNLPYLAALTPREITVEIVDDSMEEINFTGAYDFIGITAMTGQATRAYQIADKFREKGRKVIMGGIHATALPEEALQHCDSVVIGEVENLWKDILEDFRSGKPEQIYKAEQLADLRSLPMPRYELLKQKKFFSPFVPIQATRGCPHNCNFCAVSTYYGNKYRFRPVEDVVKEIVGSGYKKFYFCDDNITANRKYSRELFKALIPLKINWVGQSTVNLGRDEELCKLAAASGCHFMCLGIESVDQDNLISMNKGWSKVSDFHVLLNNMRRNGLSFVLNMIVGFDKDDNKVFSKIYDFSMECKTFFLALNTPIPYPGTKFAQELEDNGRLLHKDWSKYVQGGIVYKLQNMDPEELRDGYWRLLRKFFSIRSILIRAGGQPLHNLAFYFDRNIGTYLSVKKGRY
ncbi:MAG: B12-binding domain-containing radical SAM protein [Nitrospirae bacterium]|nr:B12-binding domain-containing radical SAM protein [Nitrospirota bacterium]